jgi:Fe-S oxidoreductase
MWKEPEKGDEDVNEKRTRQAIETKPEVIAAGCPFCNTMMTDGVKGQDKEDDVAVKDVAELIAEAEDL